METLNKSKRLNDKYGKYLDFYVDILLWTILMIVLYFVNPDPVIRGAFIFLTVGYIAHCVNEFIRRHLR